MIIIRTLRKDIANYNKEDDIVCVCPRGWDWREGSTGQEGSSVQTWVYCLFLCPYFALSPGHGRSSCVVLSHTFFCLCNHIPVQMSSDLSSDCRQLCKCAPWH